MKQILLIDSVTPELYIALLRGNELISKTFNVQRAHDRNINILVRAVLDAGKISFADLAAFAVVTGPGSWTGSRVSVTAVKAYAFARPSTKIIALEALSSKEALVKEAWRKFESEEFSDPYTLAPAYDGEFIVQTKTKN